MKLLLCFLMMFSNFVYAEPATVSVVANSCIVYEDASFENPILIDESPLSFPHGTILSVLNDDSSLDFIKISVDKDNNLIEGFVYRYYVTYASLEQEVYPVFNGSVLNEGAIIYDLEKNPSQFVAKQGQGIYFYEGFDSKEEFNAVAIVLEDGNLYYGYMQTRDVSPYGVNAGLITGIVVIISCLTIIFLLMFMKKTKRQ